MDPEPVPAVACARWRAMGSDAEVIVVAEPEDAGRLVVWAQDRVEQLEARWSRFRPDSEVSRLNAHAGEPVEVHPDTSRLVRMAVESWRESGGAVNPTVLGAVVAAGYDERFAGFDAPPTPPAAGAIVACTDIAVEGSTVTLPAGTGFDPGGIGKGLAADLVAEELIAAGVAGVCVNLGGDVRVFGRGPQGAGWTIAIEAPDPAAPPLALVGLRAGAVATSTTLRRRWTGTDGATRHHLIDPWTGLPSDTDVVQATVLAATCAVAERHAKTIVLRGSSRAFDVLPADMAAVRIDADGGVSAAGPLADYLGGRPLLGRFGQASVDAWSTSTPTSGGTS